MHISPISKEEKVYFWVFDIRERTSATMTVFGTKLTLALVALLAKAPGKEENIKM